MTETLPTVDARLDRIEAKIDRLIGGPPAEILTTKEAMHMTGTRTYSSLYRILAIIGVRAYAKGKYRRLELQNAIAKQSLRARIGPH